jgi:hypothetical protein
MSIDTNGRTHQGRGVHVGGQYATEARTEPGVTLGRPGPVPGYEQSVRTLAASFRPNFGDSAEHYARQEIGTLVDAVGPDVPADYVAAIAVAELTYANHTSYERPTGHGSYACPEAVTAIRDAYASGMPADWPDQMAQRGDRWAGSCIKRWNAGVTADELARLDAAGLAVGPGWAQAYAGCDAQQVLAWHDAIRADPQLSTYMGRYVDHAAIGRYVRTGVPLEDVKLCCELGVEPGLAERGLRRPDGTVEKGPDAIRELAAYAQAAGQSTDEAAEGIAAGLPASALKEYGPYVSVAEIAPLQAAGVPGKVARSLRAKERQMAPHLIARLHDAGISTGADYRGWMEATETVTSGGLGGRRQVSSDLGAAVNLAKAGVPLPVARTLHDQHVPIGAIGHLHAAGVDDAAPWHEALHKRSETIDPPVADKATAAYRAIAAFAAAGGSVEQMRRAHRAGVRLSELPEHVRSTPEQLWAAGAANRAAVLAEEQRRFTTWGPSWATEPVPWEATGPDDL